MNGYLKLREDFLAPSKESEKESFIQGVRPSPDEPGQRSDWYPLAVTRTGLVMPTRGTYKNGYPKGAIVHFTAGRFTGGVKKAIDTIEGGIRNGYTFMAISEDGEVVQAHPLSKWGYHAGTSAWPGLSGGVNDDVVGIEVLGAGKLDVVVDEKTKKKKFVSWYGLEIPANQVREVKVKTENQQKGAYHKYTEAQEKALVELLIWMKRNNPSVFSFDSVLGHDEVAPSRKNDPGGSLSSTMPKFREFLKAEYARRYET